MYEAYEATPILERLPLEIESLTAYDGNLVVGTRQGHLLMYSVGESGVQSDVQLLRSNKNFSRKPITQVAVVPHYQILISLSDNIISIHDLTVYNFPLLSIMNNTKGASVFDVEIKHQTTLTGGSAVVVRLAVVVRKRMQLYYLKGRQFQSLTPDVLLLDIPRHVKWSKDSLILDQTAGYRRMHVNCCKDCVPGAMESPVPYSGDARLIRAGSRVLQVSGATMTEAGTTGPSWSLGWTAPPSQAVWQAPYLLAVVGRQVEVVSDREALLLQTLSLNKPRLLVPDESGGVRPRVFCASLSHVWCLRGVASRTQVDGLVCVGHYGLAIRLLDSWGGDAVDCASSREHIHKLHAFHLFCNGRYQEALDTFLEIDTELLFVLGLFPSIMPDDCQRRLQYPAPPPPMPPDALHTALIALIDYLLKKRQRLVGGRDSGRRSSKNNNNDVSYKKGRTISRRDSASSVASVATQKKRGTNHHELQVVDTSLLKCYLQERPSLVAPLLRFPDGRVSLAEAERLLQGHQRLPDLLLLLRARGQHQRALMLLRQHQHAGDTALRGTAALVDYLLHMGAENLDVIMQQVSVLAPQHPLEALRVCTGDGAASTDCDLPRSRVAEYLLKNQPRLALLYLEHIIHEWSDQSSVSHNALAGLYRDCIMEEVKRERQQRDPEHLSTAVPGQPPPTAGDASVPVYHPDLTFDLPTMCRKLEAFLRSSKYYTPATVLLGLDQHERLLPGRAVVLGRLGQHREALSILITALHDLPAALRYCSSHYAETGPASQVYLLLLELLVQCQDVVALMQSPSPHADSGGTTLPASSAAPAGTATTAVSGGGSSADAALTSGSCDRTALLLNLLHTYSRYIRLKPAVQLLPPGMRVQELRVFLQSWVRQYSGARRRTLLQRGVAEAVGRQVQSDMSNAQTNKVLLSTQTSCCICRKRLTRFSAFVVAASGSVCHFSCQEQLRGAWQREVSAAGERRAVLARTRAALAATGDRFQ